MSFLFPVLATLAAVSAGAEGAGEDAPAIVPAPKHAAFHGTWALPDAGACAIQIGAEATAPEVFAAERLARDIRQRFGRKIAVVRAAARPAGADLVFVLGTRAGNPVAADLTKRRGQDVRPASFGKGYSDDDRRGLDGYVIDAFEAEGGRVVLVAGMNGRAVIYGADTLLQLVRPAGDGVELVRATIRDWASIPWRGSVSSLTRAAEDDPDHDARIRARLNFIDTRFPGGRWIHAGALKAEQYAEFKRSVGQAHRRGMRVYAHIISGERKGYPYEAIAAEFEKLLDLGADGMWIGYDDEQGGSDPIGTARKLVALAKRRGLSGRLIAHTPPSLPTKIAGTYFSLGKTKEGHAHFLEQVPELREGLYWITIPPSRAQHDLGKAVGLAGGRFAWWHNWPRYGAGLTHGSYGGATLRTDGKPAYTGLVPLSLGWGRPNTDRIRNAKDIICAVWLNATTAFRQPAYIQNVLGFWAWHPEKYDYDRTRRRTFAVVFGSGQIDAATKFDSLLRAATRRLSPPHVAPNVDPGEVRAFAAGMKEAVAAIASTAPRATLIDPERLQSCYLEPMQAVANYAATMADLGRPPASLGAFRERMVYLLDTGDTDAARSLLAEATTAMQPHLDRMARDLSDYQPALTYAAQWKRPLSGVDYWITAAAGGRAKRIADRERNVRKMSERFERIIAGDHADLLAPAAKAPPGKPLARIDGADWRWSTSPPSWNGPWGIGRYRHGDDTFTAVVFPKRTKSRPGQFAEVRAALPAPLFKGRLLLDVFINDSTVTTATGHRFLELHVNGRRVWEEDSAVSRAGAEWVTVDVTKAARDAEQLDLRFRVADRRGVGNWRIVTFVGRAILRAE